MKTIIWIILPLALMGMYTPSFNNHKDLGQVDTEFNNIENTLQSQDFNVSQTTPALSSMRDHQIMIISSGAFSSLMWRDGNELWQVKGSCVTVRR